MSALKFEVTAEQKEVLRRSMVAAEKIASDLQALFKKDLLAAVEMETCLFADSIATGKPCADNGLKALAEASVSAWKFFTELDELNGDAIETPAPVESFKGLEVDVTYTVRYETKVQVPLGERIADGLMNIEIPENAGSKYVEGSFHVDTVRLNGQAVPVAERIRRVS
jgi:hypothetical protein